MLDTARAGAPEQYRRMADYLATINLSSVEHWQYELKTLPRPKGQDTRAIVTEYDMVRPTTEPHDILVDKEGNVWYTDFGEMFIGKLDPKTLKLTEYPIRKFKDKPPTGLLSIEFDHAGKIYAKTTEVTWYATPTAHARSRRLEIDDQDRVLVTEYRTSKAALFDTKTEKFTEYSLPEYTFPYRANFDKNGELWASTMSTDRVVRLDPKTGHAVQYLMPSDTNMRTVFVDNSTTPVTFWVGSNHDPTIVKTQPLYYVSATEQCASSRIRTPPAKEQAR